MYPIGHTRLHIDRVGAVTGIDRSLSISVRVGFFRVLSGRVRFIGYIGLLSNFSGSSRVYRVVVDISDEPDLTWQNSYFDRSESQKFGAS